MPDQPRLATLLQSRAGALLRTQYAAVAGVPAGPPDIGSTERRSVSRPSIVPMPSASTAQFDENVASPWALTGGAAGAATNGALPSDAAAIGSEEQELGAGEGGERRFEPPRD